MIEYILYHIVKIILIWYAFNTMIKKSNTKTLSKDIQSAKEILSLKDRWARLPNKNDILEGKVIGKESGTLYIDLGPTGTGIIYGKEYYSVQDSIKDLKPGDSVTAKLIEFENEDGFRELSMKEAGDEKNWQSLREMQEKNDTTEVKVLEANRGGLLVQAGDMNGFLPVSQLAPAHYPRVDGGNKEVILEELKKFIGEKMIVRILDMDPREGKLIFSEKSAEESKIKDELSNFKTGDIVEGTITGVVDFGAFMKFTPLLEGLIHISELDWNMVKDPRNMLKVGEKVKAKIANITPDGRISLSIKELTKDPWEEVEKRLKTGAEMEREVNSITSYGALVKIEDGVQGLLHVSEFENEEQMRKKIQTGKTYKFKITNIEPEDRKVSLQLLT